MRLMPTLLVLSLVFVTGSSPNASAAKSVVYRFAIHHTMKKATDARPVAQWLTTRGFDIAGMSLGKQEIEVITDDQGLALLTKNGYTGRIIDRQIDGKATLAPDPAYPPPAIRPTRTT